MRTRFLVAYLRPLQAGDPAGSDRGGGTLRVHDRSVTLDGVARHASRGHAEQDRGHQQRLRLCGFSLDARRAGPQARSSPISELSTSSKCIRGSSTLSTSWKATISASSVWGSVDPAGAVAARARAMRHPDRIHFGGQTAEPAAALSGADIFFYPLQPDHYGTAENALVEAMSLGLVPVVLNNPAEMAIVRHGETGFVARSIDECIALLQMLLSSPELLEQSLAQRSAPCRRNPDAGAFGAGIHGVVAEVCSASRRDLAISAASSETNPADWFLATQCLPGETWSEPGPGDSGQCPIQPRRACWRISKARFPAMRRCSGWRMRGRAGG